MQGNLLVEFEKSLDNETQRVVSILVNKYYNKETIKESFENETRKLLTKDFKYYWCEIELRMHKFIPDNLVPDYNGNLIFLPVEEANENHLLKYINYCKEKEKGKDHIGCAKKLAKIIVSIYEKDSTTNLSLQKIVSDNINDLMPEHNDSIDALSIVLLLQSEIEDLGYIISSLLPLRLQKK